jgi:hypothetical protein
MPKQNPYFLTENYKKVEEIRIIESDFNKSQQIRQLEEKEAEDFYHEAVSSLFYSF